MLSNIYEKFTIPFDFLENKILGFKIRNLESELEAARSFNKELEIKNSFLESRVREFENLNVSLGGNFPSGKTASILSLPPQSPFDVILVNAGKNDGIGTGLKAVIKGGILVGTVDKVYDNSAEVKLLSYPGLKTEGYLEASALNVALQGLGASNLKFSVPKEIELKTGDRVISNTNPAYLIGEIAYIKKDPSEPLQEAILRFPLNLRNERFVEFKR